MERNSTLKSSLGKLLRALCDLMILNVLWAICSLPVLTVGPATSALFNIELKITKDEPVSTIKEFFSAFKDNFKQAFVLGIIAIFATAVFWADITFALAQEGSGRTLYIILSSVVGVLLLIFVTFAFPLQARYENTLKGCIINALKLAFVAPGKTILMWIIYAIPILIILTDPYTILAYAGWAYVLFGISGPCYITSKILHKIFDKISGAKETDESRES